MRLRGTATGVESLSSSSFFGILSLDVEASLDCLETPRLSSVEDNALSSMGGSSAAVRARAVGVSKSCGCAL